MRQIVTAALCLIGLGACGMETATTAATVAAVKQQEIEQGQKAMAAMQEKIEAAAAQTGQRTKDADSSAR